MVFPIIFSAFLLLGVWWFSLVFYRVKNSNSAYYVSYWWFTLRDEDNDKLYRKYNMTHHKEIKPKIEIVEIVLKENIGICIQSLIIIYLRWCKRTGGNLLERCIKYNAGDGKKSSKTSLVYTCILYIYSVWEKSPRAYSSGGPRGKTMLEMSIAFLTTLQQTINDKIYSYVHPITYKG